MRLNIYKHFKNTGILILRTFHWFSPGSRWFFKCAMPVPCLVPCLCHALCHACAMPVPCLCHACAMQSWRRCFLTGYHFSHTLARLSRFALGRLALADLLKSFFSSSFFSPFFLPFFSFFSFFFLFFFFSLFLFPGDHAWKSYFTVGFT